MDPTASPFAHQPSQAPSSAEARRREPRARALLAGKLVFGAQDLTGDCTIRNLSSTGAKLQTSLATSLPKSFWLIALNRGQAYRSCTAWRRGEELGVRFESSHDLSQGTEAETAYLRLLWRKLRSL